MRNLPVVIALILGVSALATVPAQAAVVSRTVTTGTTADISVANSVPGSSPECTIDFLLVVTGAANVERASGASGSNVSGFVQRIDTCAGQTEFGSFDVPLTNGFQFDRLTATLNATIPVAMEIISPEGGTVTRTLSVALLFEATPGENVVTKTRSLLVTPTTRRLSRGSGVFHPAAVTGVLSFDGVPMLASGSSSQGNLLTGSSTVIELIR